MERARDVLAQITGVNCSIGAVSQAHGKVAQALAMPVQQATAALAQAQVLHVDETRYPREGTNSNWVWGVVAPKVALLDIYVSQALIGTPQAVVVSDRYAAYAGL